MAKPTSSFFLLDERIQRFIWAEHWESLRDAQELAIPLIVEGERDVIIAAATATGKTEAAFFPALTHLLQLENSGLIVYVSPLKALINDQFRRLTRLCDLLGVPVWPWHGDISSTTKHKFLAKPSGVLLITPESLEATLCNRGSSVRAAFGRMTFCVVDELHAFIGTERGKQLQSLLHRIERAIDRPVPRIGLSATLGDMAIAADFLRPGRGPSVALVESKSAGSELRVLVKGFQEPAVRRNQNPDEQRDTPEEEQEPATPRQIAAHLYKHLRGSNNLIFPNSRREVERYTYLLNSLCETVGVPKEFWPHHGSLSNEIRTETEAALKQKEIPATAVCTNTLELGIDIGAVESVGQIGPPSSVASLRQRLGRSGRREGRPAILRAYSIEDELHGHARIDTELRLDTVRMIAMITLLTEAWFEPPMTRGAHFSTLVQQILSYIAQNGGASISELYKLLCELGAPFEGISREEFADLVRHLGHKTLLMQDSSGLLLHGELGEKAVNHYSFYAAFVSEEEFRVVSGAKTLGTLPVSQILTIGQRILFAGKTWRVEEVDEEGKTIFVARTKGGTAPLFSGGAGRVHTRVRQRMRALYESEEVPEFLDKSAARFLDEGRKYYRARRLHSEAILDQGVDWYLFTWRGDAVNEAIAALLNRRGFTASASGPGVQVLKTGQQVEDILNALGDAAVNDPPTPQSLLKDARNLRREKWDWALPEALLQRSYASLQLNIGEALEWSKTLVGPQRRG